MTVKKSTLDNAIKAMQDLKAAFAGARAEGRKINRKVFHQLCDIVHGYCAQMREQIEGQADTRLYFNFWDIVDMSVNSQKNPNETAYKILAVLGVEVAE